MTTGWACSGAKGTYRGAAAGPHPPEQRLSWFELTPNGSYFMLYRMIDSIPRIALELNVQGRDAGQDTEASHG